MSCMNCNLRKESFPTEKDFIEFEMILERLISLNQMTIIGKKIDTRFLEIKYRCNACGSVWVLSVPDQAFRGGFNEE